MNKSIVELGTDKPLKGGSMKGFDRQNQLLALCGLNCGLCPMFLDKHCPGCGGGEGNQSCKIARCSMEHDGVEYCFQCSMFPCERYEQIDDYDLFITGRRKRADLEKARQIGLAAYNAEQKEKAEILNMLLSNFNDGRRKTFYCLAVNLLDLSDMKSVLDQVSNTVGIEDMTPKEKSSFVTGLFRDIAAQKEIDLKLRKKK